MTTTLRHLALLTLAALGAGAHGADFEVAITPGADGAMQVHVDGDLFTIHQSRAADRPFFYPVLGPSGQHLTRRWPMEEGEGEEPDHRHHRGLWYVHGDMNGHDFWSEGIGARIVQTGFEVVGGNVLVTENAWVSAAGDTICTDRRRHRFVAGNGYRQIDVSITLVASAGPLVIGDTKEGSMAIRLPAPMRVTGEVAAGRLLTSEGRRDADAWGTRAAWCASLGEVDGHPVAVTIMDHPANPRHPCWWHARTYGLMAANAVGQHYFEKKPEGTINLPVEAGQDVTFRYRILIHEGDGPEAAIAKHYAAFSRAYPTAPNPDRAP